MFGVENMGVRRLFAGEGKIFQGGRGGGKNILFDGKTPKKILFCQKNAKSILFWSARGGQGPLLPSPADAHGGKRKERAVVPNQGAASH
jgi:hypothetical protein